MDQSDNDLQGTDGSGSLGGPDVRRRIPIKLISKQAVRSKPVVRPQRVMNRIPSKPQPGDEDGFAYKQEERFECKSGDAFASQRRYPQQMLWDYKLNLIGEKDETPMHFCDKCGLPIKIYGRMIPCKHVFCYDCAVLHEKKGDKLCPGVSLYSCTDPVQRIEQCLRGSLFMCSMPAGPEWGGRPAPAPAHPTDLPPERFLLPPDKHRLPPLPHLPKPHVLLPPPLQHAAHDPYGQPPHEDMRPAQAPPPSSSDLGPPRSMAQQETFRIATVTTRKHSNLITVPIQDDSAGSAPGSSSSREPLPQPGSAPAPPHHHPGDYPGQPVVSHPHHLMAQQQHYGPPPPPPPPISHPIQHPSQGSGTPHMVYSQAPPPPLSSAPPPITPPPGHIINQMPPYMNHPPPGPPPPVSGPPPHHYNPASMQQFSEDQGTLSPPFTQPGGLSPGMWPAPRGPPPPRMQGPPPQGQMPGPHHPDQSRYRPYYQ
ncbi:hypothetical protein AGOR_G00247400 [Albula goreensis]|uniref:RING-type E3 ubiquitin transferase n=1 Tax=Albula goreensis TaxID=1534307 RepID=A0A8T3CAY9_9TELE|nr:hypothetical protein AGOR_G00247400 [Albula goreensis]